ncbi:hypothetical protein [Streptomyces reticuli]|uniref:hypothetical protein n=1 Tax=Streptomyces reticuli TaxID=1926 RepID=UPI00073DD8E2|nr:hypothetical protein [Streptomyces sp. SID7810]CUW29655.1 hypothetical protein TUE45_04364 [Streptomyces reticuli]
MPSRAQRPRIPEVSEAQRRARLAWNGGKVGKTRPAAAMTPFEVCTADGCGSPATTGQPPTPGMVKVIGSKDGAPAHWFCPGRCTVLARTRAELRAVPRRPGGGR